MNEQSINNLQPLWLRFISAAALFLFVGVIYFISWKFWAGRSGFWADKYPDMGYPHDNFYLTYIWGPVLLILLIVPATITLTNIRWFWKISYWILSFVLAFITWIIWFAIEGTS